MDIDSQIAERKEKLGQRQEQMGMSGTAPVIVHGPGAHEIPLDEIKQLHARYGTRFVRHAKHLIDFVAMSPRTLLLCDELPAIYDRNAHVVHTSDL